MHKYNTQLTVVTVPTEIGNRTTDKFGKFTKFQVEDDRQGKWMWEDTQGRMKDLKLSGPDLSLYKDIQHLRLEQMTQTSYGRHNVILRYSAPVGDAVVVTLSCSFTIDRMSDGMS